MIVGSFLNTLPFFEIQISHILQNSLTDISAYFCSLVIHINPVFFVTDEEAK
jgi:hypothetical protein